jgi:hypothetical protein
MPESLAPTISRRITDSANTPTLLQSDVPAKSNPDSDPEVQRMIDSIGALAPRHAAMKSALNQYVLTDRPIAEIAADAGYTAPAVLYWIRKLGLRRRRRGCRPLIKPTAAHQQVLELVRNHGMVEAALRTGISRQRVYEVVSRWAPELKVRRRVPKVASVPKRERRAPRSIIVSFRISAEEWQRLHDSQPTTNTPGLSGCAKARAIVLHQLGLSSATVAAITPPPHQTSKLI